MTRAVFLAVSMIICNAALAGDWAHWRGPEQNGAVREKAPVTSWSQDGENLLWKSDIGGRTTPIVMNNRVYLIGPTGEGVGLREHVVCLDAGNGQKIWDNAFNVYHTDIVENRVGWTALAGDPETGNIYAHATGGELFCYGRDGKLIWKKSLTEEYGRFSGFGGRLFTPIVDEDRVILGMLSSGWGEHGKLAHRFVAFDKKDGRVLWWATPGEQPMDTTYATPVVAVIGGKRLLIAPNCDGWVYALLARTGETVWKYRLAARPLNTSPVVDGNNVYVTHSEENFDTTLMGRIACIDGTGTGDISSNAVWKVDAYDIGYCSPAVANGRLYVVDNSAKLFCLDAKTGEKKWEHSLGRVGKGSPVVTSDGVIYIGEQNGVFYILKDEGASCKVLDREQFPPRGAAIDEFYGSPALVDGRVYLQARYGTYCLGAKDAPRPSVAAAPQPAESAQPSETINRFLVVPAEVTLAPGEKVRFDAQPFHSGGRRSMATFTQEKPSFTVAGVKGAINQDTGDFTASADNAFSAGVVKVKWIGENEVAARVRICPKLPFGDDFETYAVDGTPPGWLNVGSKMKIVERDGSKVLMHLAERPTPAFMRLRTYMTPPLAGGYTIQADMLGAPKPPEWRPDMGVVNSRYELILLGSEPTLRVVTWPPIPRVQKDVPFDWKTDTWYRVKFQVKLEGGKAMLRGKVWPRDQSEPTAWTIEEIDPFPNHEGSPALYGYAAGTTAKKKGCEIYYDNVKVMANE